MLFGSVYRQLAAVMDRSYEVLSLAGGEVESEHLGPAVADALKAVDDLCALVSPWPVDRADALRRHLFWIRRRYREHHAADGSDLRDVKGVDLPAVAASIGEWERSFYDDALMEAVDRAWLEGNYLAVARDAFVHVESRLRSLGRTDPTKGLTGDKLVARLLARTSPDCLDLPDGPFKPQTTGEEEGAYYFVKGLFLLFRNAAAHRPVAFDADDAQLVLGAAQLCLRLLDPASAR